MGLYWTPGVSRRGEDKKNILKNGKIRKNTMIHSKYEKNKERGGESERSKTKDKTTLKKAISMFKVTNKNIITTSMTSF